jgi:hypothetical protein
LRRSIGFPIPRREAAAPASGGPRIRRDRRKPVRVVVERDRHLLGLTGAAGKRAREMLGSDRQRRLGIAVVLDVHSERVLWKYAS